jgi:hypothetical protein
MTIRKYPDPAVRTELRWNGEAAAAGEYSYEFLIWDGDAAKPAVEIFEDAIRQWKRLLQDWGFEETSFITGKC